MSAVHLPSYDISDLVVQGVNDDGKKSDKLSSVPEVKISFEAEPQIYNGDPRPPIPPHVMAWSAIGLKLGVFGFCRPHTQKQTQNKCIHNLHALRSLITGKLEDPQFEPHAGIKMAQVIGSPLYICGLNNGIMAAFSELFSLNMNLYSASQCD